MKYIRIRSLQQYLIRTISTSRAFFVFSDAEYPDAEFTRARRYLLGKVGTVGRVFGSVYVYMYMYGYLTLLCLREESSTTCTYMHLVSWDRL